MISFIKLKMRETRQKSLFLIFGILGSLVTVLISFVTFSTNATYDVTSDYAQYGFQWTCLSLVAAVAAVSLSGNTVEKHEKGDFADLIQLHGLPKQKQYWGIVLANVGNSMTMAVVLLVGMIISLIIKRPDVAFLSTLLAFGNYLLAVGCIALLISGLSFYLPGPACILLGMLLVVLGSVRGVLRLVIGNLGGVFAKVLNACCQILPPLSTFGQVSRDLFFGELHDWHGFFACLFYCWVLLGLIGVAIWGKTKDNLGENEK